MMGVLFEKSGPVLSSVSGAALNNVAGQNMAKSPPRSKSRKRAASRSELPKAETGIQGLDEITQGGVAQRQADPGVRRRGLWQNAASDGISGQGSYRIQ